MKADTANNSPRIFGTINAVSDCCYLKMQSPRMRMCL